MTLQNKILLDKKEARNPPTKAALNVIVGELQRQPTKELSDAQVLNIIKRLIKYEEERLRHYSTISTTEYLNILKSYVPQQVDIAEIEEWIKNNIDFSKLKNKMQAIGIVGRHFGSSASNELIKEVVTNRVDYIE